MVDSQGDSVGDHHFCPRGQGHSLYLEGGQGADDDGASVGGAVARGRRHGQVLLQPRVDVVAGVDGAVGGREHLRG